MKLKLLIAFLLWLATQLPVGAEPTISPAIIEGEAGAAGCPVAGLLAVARVNSNHLAQRGKMPAWYGWARPSPAAYHVARYWQSYPDPTRGAVHLYSRADLRKPAVQRIVRNMELTTVIECRAGLALLAYR